MKYSRLVESYRELEATQSTLEKQGILAELFREAGPGDLEILGHLVMGRAFPAWKDLDLGIGSKLMLKAISRATGMGEEEIEDRWRETGDLGNATEEFVEGKRQRTLGEKELTLSLVQENLEKIAGMEGENSQDRKISRIAELIGFATPEEARYIVRTILGDMRVGVGEGIVRNAILEAFFSRVIDVKELEDFEGEGLKVGISSELEGEVGEMEVSGRLEENNSVEFFSPRDLEMERLWRKEGYDVVVLKETGRWGERLERLVQHAYDVTTDFGLVARLASESGPSGLEEDTGMELFRPVKVMLAQKVETMEEGFEKVGDDEGVAALEFKYDGMRVQIHKKGEEVRVFTRRLEDVTEQFPDIVEAVENNVDCEEGIIEGEAVAYDPDSGRKVPFQKLSKRIKRKYRIDEMREEIPVTVFLFDSLYIDGDSLLEEPFRDRWERLQEVSEEEEKSLELSAHLETSDLDEANAFYQRALDESQEGVMLKNLDAVYKPGSRVGYMVKLKPVMETLDLVIVEADWGEGRRSNWLGSYLLACRDEESGELKTVGKMATGFTDEQLQEMTDRLEDHVVEQSGRHVVLEPEVVVEVAYEEIQKSPQYESGYALRFPRLVQVREDMSPGNANELEKVERLYESQN